MGKQISSRIDFDEWRALAAADPGAFELRRTQMLEKTIERASCQRRERLRRLQWRIDQVRRVSSTPISACIKLNGMMMDTLLGEGGLLASLSDFRKCERPVRPLRAASILPFRPRGEHLGQ